MLENHPEVDRLWKKSAVAAKNLQRLADELAKAAEKWNSYGVGNPARDAEIWHQHNKALESVLRLGEELEQAAIEAGIIPPHSL